MPESPSGSAALKLGLVGFYVGCTLVAIGAAIAAIVSVVFPAQPWTMPLAVVGGVLVVGGGALAWWALRRSRREV